MWPIISGALLRSALTLVAAFALTSAAHAQPRPDSTGFITAGDGAKLYYAIYGHARDTVIVPGGMFLETPLRTLHSDLTLVFYDPRGRGRSDWIPEGRRLTMADELRDLDTIRSRLGISKVAILGFSHWGLVSALYAADHPDRVSRIALLGPLAPDENTASRYASPEGKARSDAAAAKFAAGRATADTTDLKAECRRWYDAYLPVYFGEPGNAGLLPTTFCASENEAPSRFQWRVERTMRSIAHWDYTKRAGSITVPTLVIQGDKDFAVSPDGARKWAELIPGSRLMMLAGAGHFAVVERADRALPALNRFFTGNWPPEAMPLRSPR
jgi:pimeloyl-ACP methyl ester carboxylesterase